MNKSFLFGVIIVVIFSCASPKEPKTSDSFFPEQSEFYEDMEHIYNTMSVDEKVGQLLIVRVRTVQSDSLTDITPEFQELLLQVKPAGLIFFSKNIESSRQIQRFVSDIQLLSTIPMFITVDVEGGPVNRFKHTDNALLSHIPSAQIMSQTLSASEVKNYAFQIGEELTSLGFNMNFSPVADVLYPHTPDFLKNRIFGTTAEETTRYTTAFIEGQKMAGIISVIKHFPGHGGATGDTHLGVASVLSDFDYLQAYDFLPYKQAIQHDVQAVMLGHLKVPSIDKDNIATLSTAHIDILQQELGFTGVIISDSLTMKSASKLLHNNLEVKAINAGVNILLDPKDPKKTHEILVDAVNKGYISEEVLKNSIIKILILKKKYFL